MSSHPDGRPVPRSREGGRQTRLAPAQAGRELCSDPIGTGQNQASKGHAVAMGSCSLSFVLRAGRLLDNWAGTEPWGPSSPPSWLGAGVVVVYYMTHRGLD